MSDPTSSTSVQTQIEQEISEFRRRLRIMENDKKAYSDES